MTKVIYSNCFGGFGLSNEAIRMYLKLKGIEFREKNESFGNLFEYDEDGKVEYFSVYDLDRADPILIQVVETLGAKANSRFSDLKIIDLPPGTKYRIQEYDGNEWVETEDGIDWRIA